MTTPTRGNDETANEPPELDRRAREPWWRRPIPVTCFLVAIAAVSLGAVQLDRHDPILVPDVYRAVTITRTPLQGNSTTKVVTDPAQVAELRRVLNSLPQPMQGIRSCILSDVYELDFSGSAGGPIRLWVRVDWGCGEVSGSLDTCDTSTRVAARSSTPELIAFLHQLTS